MKLPQFLLLMDDTLVVFLVTLFGIQFHQTNPSIISRLPYNFLPFLGAWIFFAFILQMYDPVYASSWRHHWRILAAAALAAPTGAAIRALWLNTPYSPIFAIVMGAALALGLLISRGVFILVFGNK